MRLLTWNIYSYFFQNRPELPLHWAKRCEKLRQRIWNYQPDIVHLQECHLLPANFIAETKPSFMSMIPTGYTPEEELSYSTAEQNYYVKRKSFETQGANPSHGVITFYNSDKFKLLSYTKATNFQVPGDDPTAPGTRYMTYILQDRVSGEYFFFGNIHLSASSKFKEQHLAELINRISLYPDLPAPDVKSPPSGTSLRTSVHQYITGDFNIDWRWSAKWKPFLAKKYVKADFVESDGSRPSIAQSPSGWFEPTRHELGSTRGCTQLDYIFQRPHVNLKTQFQLTGFFIGRDESPPYCSDHFCLIADYN